MVKLAQTIGATGISQGTRMIDNFGSHVIEVRQNLYSDKQIKDATRVFPFSDIQYAGAEVAGKSSVIASCHVPIVAGVAVGRDQKDGGLQQPFQTGLDNLGVALNIDKSPLHWIRAGFGMSDYLFGISPERSINSVGFGLAAGALGPLRGGADFNDRRQKLYSSGILENRTGSESSFDLGSVDGTAPLTIKQYLTEEEALDEISAFPSNMIVGYVIGPRDVKLYYTEVAISMMARRMRRVVEELGPCKPTYYPLALGHLATDNKGTPWKPKTSDRGRNPVPKVYKPSGFWNAGAVQYKSRALQATGSMYIPWDQTPYSAMRRNFKYNHIMTQLGLSMMETLQAIGIDLGADLSTDKSKAFDENGSGAQVAALQMMYSSMFGVTTSHSATSDFTCEPTSIAAGIKDRLGLLFNSGHIHIDPGCLIYKAAYRGDDGLLSDSKVDISYCGRNVSPALLMKEFVAKYLTFSVAAEALQSYFAVPLYECHWLYTGSPKPEYVTEQLQMNFRSDVYFDGDNSMPFTLIPSRLNPGEVISRIPCYMDINGKEPNKYLGVRDPLPYGSVLDIRFSGDKPLTTTEERDYTFTPIIEADSSVQTQYRNSRTINCAVWPRPTHYCPGATKVGAIYGTMSDNKSVGGHYYYQPLTGVMTNDNVNDKIYRAMGVTRSDGPVNERLKNELLAGMGRKETEIQQDYWNKHSIAPEDNPQAVATAITPSDADESVGEMVFPTTVNQRKED